MVTASGTMLKTAIPSSPLLPTVFLFPIFLFNDFCQAGASETSLRFMYKSTDGIWTAPDGGSTIDVSAKVVTATTTHFSEWGVFGDAMLSITANTEATFNIADGTKLVIKGSMDAKVRPLPPLSSPGAQV